MSIQYDPIYELPFLYINGLNLSVASTTVLAIAPGQARDSRNVVDLPVGQSNLLGITNPGGFSPPSINYGPIPGLSPAPRVGNFSGFPNYYPSMPLFLNSAVVGANGLDQGTLAASSFYTVWLIGDSSNNLPVAGIISLYSNAFPLLPLGYDSYRLIGFVGTSGGTAFTAGCVLNTSSSKAFYVSPAVSKLSGGNATTFTEVNLGATVPASPFTIAMLTVNFTPAAVGDVVQFRPALSTDTTGLITVVGLTAGVSQTDYVNVMVGIETTAHIEYLVTSSSDSVSLLVNGYITTLA